MTSPGNDLRQIRIRAKELRRAARHGHPDSVSLFRAHHPAADRFTTTPEALQNITLRDAQLVLAESHGAASWHELVQRVGTSRVEEREMHRWFAVEHRQRAVQICAAVSEPEDRAVLEAELSRPPWFGLVPDVD